VRATRAPFLVVAERASEELGEPGYERVLERFDAEHDNFPTALAWACELDEVEVGLRLATATTRYWAVRGHYREGLRWLERVLALGTPTPTDERGGTLRAAGWLARLRGGTDAAGRLQSEAIAISRATGDDPGLTAALQELGLVEMHRGDHDRAVRLMAEALALNRMAERDTPRGPELVSVACANLAQITLAAGRPELAAPLVEDALERQRALGYGWALGDTLRIAGDVAGTLGDHRRAMAVYRESVELTRNHGDLRFLTNALAGIAEQAAMRSEPERAARVYAAVAVLRERIGAGIESWQVDRHERALAARAGRTAGRGVRDGVGGRRVDAAGRPHRRRAGSHWAGQ
jgi:tetratricopeptide (TPR) repeat protein